jgi:hypothetical protein
MPVALLTLLPTILKIAPSLITTVEGLFNKKQSGEAKMTSVINSLLSILTELQNSGAVPKGTLPSNSVLQSIIEMVLSQMKLTGKLNETDVENTLLAMFGAPPVSTPTTTPTVKTKESNKTNKTMTPTTTTTTTLTPTTQQAFDNAYWASQPPQVTALNSISDFTQRSTEALTLAQQGFTIDVPIMVWDWDPYLVMLQRENYGFTWVPSMLQSNVSIAPGVTQPGTVPYNPNNPPAGSIKVSLSLADYPPFATPAPTPVPTPATSLVGINTGAGFYAAVLPAAASLTNGQIYTGDPRGTFTFHVASTPFGSSYWFTLNS